MKTLLRFLETNCCKLNKLNLTYNIKESKQFNIGLWHGSYLFSFSRFTDARPRDNQTEERGPVRLHSAVFDSPRHIVRNTLYYAVLRVHSQNHLHDWLLFVFPYLVGRPSPTLLTRCWRGLRLTLYSMYLTKTLTTNLLHHNIYILRFSFKWHNYLIFTFFRIVKYIFL